MKKSIKEKINLISPKSFFILGLVLIVLDAGDYILGINRISAGISIVGLLFIVIGMFLKIKKRK